MLTGGCFCGFVRYEATGTPFHLTSCHCSMCRRTSAAPFVPWFSVPRAGLRFVAGTATHFRSSDHGQRSFCPRCGTPLTFASQDSPDEIDVTICSLDDPAALAPADHTHVASRLPWVKLADDLPAFPGARADGPAGPTGERP